MIQAEIIDGNKQINRYDAEGLCYEIEENSKLVQFSFNENKEVVVETNQAGINRLIRSQALVAVDADYARTYYHYTSDELGSITHITDEKGNVVNQYEYDVWGNITKKEETISNRFNYNGQQLDPITQQYYLRARYYNPVIARFTQEDAYRGDGLNLYAYCANNPVKYGDPSGYEKQVYGKESDNPKETFVDMMDTQEAARYERYWKQNYNDTYKGATNTRERQYATPGTRSIVDQKINEKTGDLYSRETIYDKYGRRIGNNDYTNHGRPDVPAHTNPHYHANPWINPNQHGPATPGLHPETPQ